MSNLAILAAALLALNAWITRRVVRAPSDHLQNKAMLIVGIWLMPLFGAVIASFHLRACVPGESSSDEALPEGHPAPVIVTAPGAPDFAFAAHVDRADGFARFDWPAFARWLEPLPDDATRRNATDQARRAWLLHLRDTLGPGFTLRESNEAWVLSSLEPNVARASAEYVAKTRKRVAALLGGLAAWAPDEQSILIVFDDEDSYYRYVSHLYPSDGEFAASGGMFIEAGCPHFITRRADLSQIEPVIAHELTHSALAHLQLPLWLDEGIAVNTQHRLTGVPGSLHTPNQLRAKHLRFWGDEEIQQFWTGESFHRVDDGQMLSYDLARILVQSMAGDRAVFESFARNAARDDAGDRSAREHLGAALATTVCALLGREPTPAWVPAQPQPA